MNQRKECPATVFDHSLFKANTGSPGIQIIAQINDAGSLKTREGTLWLTPACLDRTVLTLSRTFGYEGSLDALNAGEVLTGKKFIAVMEQDDRGREKIAFFNSLGTSRRLTLDQTEELSIGLDGLLSEARARMHEKTKTMADADGTPQPDAAQAVPTAEGMPF